MSLLNVPRTALVTVLEPALLMPRIVMHMCSASTTTMTPSGSKLAHEGVGDLGGEALLHLQPVPVARDAARDLRETRDATRARDVADARTAEKRQDVMLAHRGEGDVPHHDHLLVVLLLELFAQVGAGILLHAAQKLLAGARHALRRAGKALAVRVLPYGEQELTHRRLDAGLVEAREALVVDLAAKLVEPSSELGAVI